MTRGQPWRVRTVLRSSAREAGILLLVAAVLGLTYNGVTRKGLFRSGSNTTEGDQNPAAASPRFITYEEALSLFQSKTAVFVDSRHEYDYKLGHIQGALNVPLKEFDSRKEAIARIPREALVVAYCDGEECNSSLELAVKLSRAGFSNVKVFYGGWREWQAHQQPTE